MVSLRCTALATYPELDLEQHVARNLIVRERGSVLGARVQECHPVGQHVQECRNA